MIQKERFIGAIRRHAPELTALNPEALKNMVQSCADGKDSILYESSDGKYRMRLAKRTEWQRKPYIKTVSGGSVIVEQGWLLTICKLSWFQGGYGPNYHEIAALRIDSLPGVLTVLMEAKL